MANVLSHKPRGILVNLALEDWKRSVGAEDYDLQYYKDGNIAFVYNITTTPIYCSKLKRLSEKISH